MTALTLFEIVALFVAINLFILLTLSYLVIKQRQKQSVISGTGESEDMALAIRVHGNFTEYAPLGMIGLLLMAGLSAHPYMLYGVGGAFTLGRLLHAYGYSKSKGVSFGRYYGMVITLLSLVVMAVYLLYLVFT